jgi:hypothetical protein
MGYILKNTSGLINTRLTDTGRQKISQGNFNITYFQIGDSEVSYNTLPQATYNQFNSFVLEPSFNAQNSAGKPQSNKENIKYPYYVDGVAGNTYGIPFMASIVEPVYNRASPRGFFVSSSTNGWSAVTNNTHVINSNYVVDMSTLVGTNTIDVIYNSCNESPVRPIQVGDFITIYYDGNGLYDCYCLTATTTTTSTSTTTTTTNPCVTPLPTTTTTTTTCSFINSCCPPPKVDCSVNVDSCYSILTYRVTNVCLDTLTLDRPTPDFSYLNTACIARVLVYPSSITEIYDSVTPSNHWSNDVINYESVCLTDEFDVKIWNMNIPWSENPAGLDPNIDKDYTNFGSIDYLGSKEYFGYASSSGQTDTSNVYYYNSFDEQVVVTPEEQKSIAIIHYTNQTVDLFYGEKFALEPFNESVDDTTGQARNFRIDLPWLMWHKNPDCCNGQSFYVDPPNFDGLNLFTVHYLESTKNSDMNDPGLRYYHLWDTNPNTDGYPSRIGKVFPDSKIIVIDDEEIIAAMSYKSNRNWTLPAPKISLVTPNICGVDNNSAEGILSANTEYMYVTYRLSNTFDFTNSLHCNYYSTIQGPNITCLPTTSQNVALRFGSEFPCINEPYSVTTTTTTSSPCWLNSITLYVASEELLFPGYFVYTLSSTGLFSNGYPIYSSYLPGSGILNMLYNGTNWEFNVSNLDSPNYTLIFYSINQIPPIGNLTAISGELEFTGYTTCDIIPIICLELSESGLTPTLTTLIPYSTGSEIYYLDQLSSVSVIYDTPNSKWVMSGLTEIAELTGLTINDSPYGNWTVIDPTYTSITSSEISTCFSSSCECFTFENVSSETTFVYSDCNLINSQIITLNIGESFTGCSHSIDGNLFVNVNDTGDSYTICESACTPTTTTTTTSPITTTSTTLCPPICNLTSGFYANKFEVICQKVDGSGRPESNEWKIIDFTDQLLPYMVNGYITQESLTANTFVITQELYDSALIYGLNDYINLTPVGFSGQQLNFGDEYYFYGNIETDIQATIYEMVYKINLSQAEFQTPSNTSWSSTNNRYITEIGLYDSDKNLMIISKIQSPILRQGIQQFLIKLDI